MSKLLGASMVVFRVHGGTGADTHFVRAAVAGRRKQSSMPEDTAIRRTNPARVKQSLIGTMIMHRTDARSGTVAHMYLPDD